MASYSKQLCSLLKADSFTVEKPVRTFSIKYASLHNKKTFCESQKIV